MAKKRPIIFKLTRYVKGEKKSHTSYGFYNEDNNTLVLCMGETNGKKKWLVRNASYSSAVSGRPGEYTMKIDNLYEKTVPVYDTKSRNKSLTGYETDILSYSHSYLWYKFK